MTKIKICGLRRPIDAEYVNNAGADFAGLVFWDKSKRNLTFEEAREIRKALNPEIKTLGVFVDRDIDDIAYLVKEGIISGVQLHGSEDEDTIKKVRAAVPEGTWILKAFEVKSIEDVEKAQNSSADMVLIDSGKGSGKVFDWELLSHLKRDYILAGGLGIENVSEAVETLHPFAVDVSSGVETDRFKDESKINDFCNAVKQADGRQ